MRKASKLVLLTFLLQLARPSMLLAQQSQPQQLTLNQAVDLALSNYPAIRAARAQAAAAGAGIELARTSFLPRADLLWQENRATTNNVFGLLLPQAIIPSISGPVLGTKSLDSVWGSVGGMLVSWEPFDFGLRKANVDVARAQAAQANANVIVSQLDAEAAAADAFLSTLAAEQTVRAAQANVERMQTFAKAVHVLVDNQLRAGADASRADAELAAARIQLIQTQQTYEIARLQLADALGIAGNPVSIDTGPLLELPATPDTATYEPKSHPLALAQSAAIDAALARERAVNRSYVPRFSLQTGFSARGTGAPFEGRVETTRGLLPQTPNWASGVSISFPILDVFAIRSRRRAEASNEAAERARYDQTIQTLKTQNAKSRTLIEAARRIAETTPTELRAAREGEVRARARYEAQLTNVTEVAEAQRLLAQAEADDAVARLAVWRALLASAKAKGDLAPFLNQILNTPVQRRKQ